MAFEPVAWPPVALGVCGGEGALSKMCTQTSEPRWKPRVQVRILAVLKQMYF